MMASPQRRWLVGGCSLRAITLAVLLLLLLLPAFAGEGDANTAAAAAGEEEPGATNSASEKSSVDGALPGSNTTTAAAEGGIAVAPKLKLAVGNIPKAPESTPTAPDKNSAAFVLPQRWYAAWGTLLQHQMDSVFSLAGQRASLQGSGSGSVDDGPPSRRGLVDDGLGFKIHLIGDSTVRAQANLLAWLLAQRTALDGKKQCFRSAIKEESGWADVFCTEGDEGVGLPDLLHGDPSKGNVDIFLTVHYTKTYNGCIAEEVDADYVYFGCGLHFLQLIPNRAEERARLDAWVHYERILEEAVLFFRSGGGREGNRVPVGEAFMTTHSFTVERLEGAYLTRVQEYAEENEPVLTHCRAVVNAVEPIHGNWTNEYEPEEICTKGVFDDVGVADLNRRAEGVMDRLGVPTVKAYDITKGQAWATPVHDGRHYGGLVPLEVTSMLSEITAALRRERRTAASA